MLGAIIGAGASLLGGILGNKSQSDINEKNIELQKQFAQQGIQWKVADAKAAGIHPLYALGAQTHSFSNIAGGNPLGEGIAAAGQDLGRAVESQQSTKGQASAFVKTAQLLQLKRMALENDLLSSQIATTRQPGNPPPLNVVRGGNGPIPGQNSQYMPSPVPNTLAKDQGQIQVIPVQRQTTEHGGVNEPGSISSVAYARTPTGWAPVPSADMKSRIEDDPYGETIWTLNNRVLPIMGGKSFNPPSVKVNKGEVFTFNPMKMEYQSVPYDSTNWIKVRDNKGGWKWVPEITVNY